MRAVLRTEKDGNVVILGSIEGRRGGNEGHGRFLVRRKIRELLVLLDEVAEQVDSPVVGLHVVDYCELESVVVVELSLTR